MGIYSNVYATSLKNAASIALSELANYSLDGVKSNLSNISNLDSGARQVLINSISNIINSYSLTGSIVTLRQRLNNIISACDKIESIQSKENSIYKYKNYKIYRDENNKIKTYYKSRIQNLQSQVSDLEWEINNLLS